MKGEDALSKFLDDFLHALDTESNSTESARLKDLFKRSDFRALIQLFSTVSAHRLKESSPQNEALLDLVSEVCNLAREKPFLPQVQELLHCLNRPHMQAVFSAHDQVARREYEPSIPQIPYEVDEDEGTAVKIVCLVKNSEPLGATIKVNEKSGQVQIARILHGGVASRSSCINIGDRLLEVNSVSVTGKSAQEIVSLLSTGNSSGKNIVLKLIPSSLPEQGFLEGKEGFLKACFEYNPFEDKGFGRIPCAEAGLSFKKGDVLRVVDDSDPLWWQARIETRFSLEGAFCRRESSEEEGETKAGLVPSLAMLEKRRQAKSTTSAKSRLKHVMYEARTAEELDTEETGYEAVSRLFPREGARSVVVLLGAPGVGRNELKRRVLLLNPEKYCTTIPHTSRAPKNGEMDGVDYLFVQRAKMEEWVRQGRLLEFGEYKGNLYGTLIESVKAIVARGQVAILNPHSQALRHVRTEELKAFVVFVKPPPFAALKESRSRATNGSASYSRGFSDAELEAMIENSQRLQELYGHWFDYTLVNGNLEAAFRELCDVMQRLDTDVQWVPSQWLLH